MSRFRKIFSHFDLNTVVLMFLILSLLFGCKKFEPERTIKIETGSVTNVSSTSCTAQGIILDKGKNGIIQHGFCWAVTQNPTTANNKTQLGSKSSTGNFSGNLTDLLSNTIYYVRAYATNSVGTVYGDELSFRTLGTFTDNRDNNTYNWVRIGEQVWMAENLAYLPAVGPPSIVSETAYYYVHDYSGINVSDAKTTSNYKTFGVLYNWPAAQNACPTGWHLPTNEEWEQLAQYISDTKGPYSKTKWGDWIDVGKHLKTALGWNNNGNGTDDFGFSGLPGGAQVNASFSDIGISGTWWSATNAPTPDHIWQWVLSYQYTYFFSSNALPHRGFSIRCLRD